MKNYEKQTMKNYRVLNKKNKWTCGYYHPTEAFKHMSEHFCVMDAKDGTLVAITGENFKGITNREEEESRSLARAVAQLPQILELLETLYGHHSLDRSYRKMCWEILQEVKGTCIPPVELEMNGFTGWDNGS